MLTQNQTDRETTMPSNTKFFRVATEGPTVDGRTISRTQIKDMADTYSLDKYGARIWLEHLRGLFPDSEFRAHGDVIALKTQENSDGELQLLAQIKPLPKLVEMNKKGQKIYSSIEVNPNFKETGKAYLMGLAITDSPASTGVEMLKFTQQHPALKDVNLNLNLTSTPTETHFIMSENTQPSGATDSSETESLLSKFTALFAKKEEIEKTPTAQSENLSEIESTLGLFAEQIKQKSSTEDFNKLSADVAKLTEEFAKLQAALNQTPEPDYSPRPAAQGGNRDGYTQTDC